MSDDRGSHEIIERQEVPTAGSERGFGIVFSIFFVIIGIFPLLDASPARYWALSLSAVFLFLAVEQKRGQVGMRQVMHTVAHGT